MQISPTWLSCEPSILDKLEVENVGFCGERTLENQEKNARSKARTKKNSIHTQPNSTSVRSQPSIIPALLVSIRIFIVADEIQLPDTNEIFYFSNAYPVIVNTSSVVTADDIHKAEGTGQVVEDKFTHDITFSYTRAVNYHNTFLKEQ